MGKQELAWNAIITEIKRRIEAGPRGTLSALARHLDVGRGTITRWLQGSLKGERVPYDKMYFLMTRLDIDPRRYFAEDGETPWSGLGGVPIIALAACGYDWCTHERLNATAPRPGDHSHNPDLFAVLAIGDSMRPAGIEPGFIVYCDPHSNLDVNDVVFVERDNGTISLKMFRGVDGAWIMLEAWTPPDSQGAQQIYTASTPSSRIVRLIPVVYVKRKM